MYQQGLFSKNANLKEKNEQLILARTNISIFQEKSETPTPGTIFYKLNAFYQNLYILLRESGFLGCSGADFILNVLSNKETCASIRQCFIDIDQKYEWGSILLESTDIENTPIKKIAEKYFDGWAVIDLYMKAKQASATNDINCLNAELLLKNMLLVVAQLQGLIDLPEPEQEAAASSESESDSEFECLIL